MASLIGVGAVFTSALGGCVIPPDLDIADADAGVSYPPQITESGPAPEFSIPGPIVLDRGDERVISLTIKDVDLDDPTYIRFFVDYGIDGKTPPQVSDCLGQVTGQAVRVVDCPTATICNTIADTDTSPHQLTAVTSDQPFLFGNDPAAVGQPPYQAIPVGAGSADKTWILKCNPPAQ